MDELVEKLKSLGLNSYEAKVYLALLKKFPATGYEAAKLANIPQSRAYDTLKALEAVQIVTASAAKPQTFTPIKPKELTKRYKRKFDSTIDFLEKKLPDVKENYTEPVLTFFGIDKILETSLQMLKNARKEIFIGLGKEDFKYFEAALIEAYNRNINVKIITYDNIETFMSVFRSTERASRNYLFLTVDDDEGLFRMAPDEAVWSKNGNIVFMFKNFMVHNMYLADIEQNFPEQLKYFYGAGLKKLKDKVLG